MSIFEASQLEHKYFEAGACHPIAYTDTTLSEVLGVHINPSDVMRLIGAPFDSIVSAQYFAPRCKGPEVLPEGLYFRATHPFWLDHEVGIYRVTENHFGIYIAMLKTTKKAPVGVGALMFGRMVRECLAYDIPSINLLAAGGRLWNRYWNGHYTWARLGFDMGLKDLSVLAAFSEDPHDWLLNNFSCYTGLENCMTVQEILAIDGGPEWWKICGTGWKMGFDSSNKNTISVKNLETYLKLKQL